MRALAAQAVVADRASETAEAASMMTEALRVIEEDQPPFYVEPGLAELIERSAARCGLGGKASSVLTRNSQR